MKRYLLLILALSSLATAQQKDLLLADIWNGSFSPAQMHSLRSMQSDHYTVLQYNRLFGSTAIDKYHYGTLEKVATLVDSKDLAGIDHIESYAFNHNETKLLLGTAISPIYRRSTTGIYFVYDLETKTCEKVDSAPIQEPSFSPNSQQVAYVKDNNLYIKNLSNNHSIPVTRDGQKNRVINGICDWVYEEEFAFVKAYEWSPDGAHLAFLRFDETEVPSFSMQVTGTELYPRQQVFKYPKAGEKNAVVSLHSYALKSQKTKAIDLGDYAYIPRIKWTRDTNLLAAITLNRHQNELNLYFADIRTATVKKVLQETDPAYIEIHDHLHFLEDNSFVWSSEQGGFRHLYHYNGQGTLRQQITSGNWEVTDFYGMDETRNTLYYQSVEDGAINRTIYSIRLNGKKKRRLSSPSGTHEASFSKNFHYFIDAYSDANTPPTYTLFNGEGKALKEILNNQALLDKLAPYGLAKKEFFQLETEHGTFNAWLLKPADFDPNKTYPLLMNQYSGPGSQEVSNQWNNADDYWFQHLAQQGYIIACVDGRGTGFRGAAFKKSTYLNLVKYETIDQINAARSLGARPYINADEIGIFGWSFGGQMAANCLFKGNEVFKVGIAVAPVTNWRFYDTIYTERYMRTPQENPEGYDRNSPTNFAHLLKGKFLLIHGSGDDNVHVQNSLRLSQALIEANKPFEQFIYPDRAHGIHRGKNTRLHLYNKMTTFIRENL